DPQVGRLLDRLATYRDKLPDDTDEARLIDVTRRDFEKAVKIPAELVGRWNAIASASYDAWTRARPTNDFAALRPYLAKLLAISREYSALFKPRHVADPLIDD